MNPTADFTHRTVLITGAGSGIGRAAALRFAALGAGVVVAELDPARAETVAREVAELGGTAQVSVGDLSDPDVVARTVATAVDGFGGLDVLINNAGVYDTMSAIGDVTDAEWERVLRVNLTAPFLMTRAALPHLLAAGRGVIVNTASEAGLRGSAAGTAYTVSKHGLIGLTRSTAVMYRDKGLRVNAVAPGGVATNLVTEMRADPTALGPGTVSGYAKLNSGRLGEADEIAAAIVFLASDAASNINGAVLPVDNGWSAV
ncbi:NAD(P)-dependent dehydrogenase (short-subunit alcohol dehydrogenase family) [Actinocorallia herbida]|uniref:NAD(P)-dependent dehydrogenase (Short-subunit alcohol dehydrogenase family) n=1 Tax=Actinocorallia herbida TaxID=58109 RepID=A0A3N1D342_9ACTN|nr:SDR family oxidoreductase [Actinocorallia herbida]ROO87942.1 NAD(P)-dependent dehydrogenase (short-subunit alcohol dehydrogenase family) [Actinocorallia herbida]